VTAQELINSSLRAIGVIASGETPSVDESADALVALNDLIESWTAQALPIFQITRSTVALTGAENYTLVTRPVKIKAATVTSTTTQDVPLQITDAAGWSGFQDKAGTADFAKVLWYEHGHPLGQLHLAPKSNGTLNLISEKPIGAGVMEVRETLSLTGAASYTVGVGGTLATERPVRVVGASIAAGSTMARDCRIVSAEEWASFPLRGAGGTFAEVLYCDGAYPSSTIRLGPKPASGGTLELYTYEALSTFSSPSESVTLPPGYERALRLALAVELGPEFGVPLTKALLDLATDAKMSIQGLNAAVLGVPGGVNPAPPAPAPAAPAE
jgi:hypothetical protein